MRQHLRRQFMLLLAAAALLAGCSAASLFAGSGESVSFLLRIEADSFSPEAQLRIRIWDSEQLEIADTTMNCAVSFNQETQTEEVHCPEGVEYREAAPEDFEFPVRDLGAAIEIESATVTVGERYRLQIAGLSNDNCNTASASVEEKAQSARIVLEDFRWAVTMMACP